MGIESVRHLDVGVLRHDVYGIEKCVTVSTCLLNTYRIFCSWALLPVPL